MEANALKEAPTGSRIWFAGEGKPYKVRARNDRYLICTKPFNPRHTVLYSIIDLVENIRGPENLVFGMGAETDQQCGEMLERLKNEESAVTHRNRVRLEVTRVAIAPPNLSLSVHG